MVSGSFPRRVCRSIRPSPVMTNPASEIFDTAFAHPSTAAAPGRYFAPRQRSAQPTPPAAPEPGASRYALPMAASMRSASLVRPASATSIPSSSSPFCGPKTAAAPLGPSSGEVTSHATVSFTPDSFRFNPDRSRRESSGNPAAPGEMGAKFLSSKRTPRASSIPAPPSVEAEPPTPTVMSVAPLRSAAAMTSPRPRLDATNPRRGVGGPDTLSALSRPQQVAISMTAWLSRKA